MPALLVALLGTLGAAADSEPPLAWSPDGRWVAYVTAPQSEVDVLPPGWLFESEGKESGGGAPPSARPYLLWCTRLESQESVRLDESPLALTYPDWKADGSALAFGRVRRGPGESARYEVVIQDGPDSSRVLKSWELGSTALGRVAGLGRAKVAWSPDSRFLAVPDGDLLGLAVIRADTGAVVQTFPHAQTPTWSPSGGRLAFLQADSLAYADVNIAETRRVTALPKLARVPAPAWSRDGQSLVALEAATSRVLTPQRMQGLNSLALVRVRTDQGRIERVWDKLTEPLPGLTVLSVSFALDPDSGLLYFTSVTNLPHNQIARCLSREHVVHSRFHPFDESLPIWSLSMASGNGARIGLRMGAMPERALDAVCDPLTQALTPLAPDDETRVRWLTQVLRTIRDVLTEHPVRSAEGRPSERATLLPGPEEIDAPDFPGPRLRHLARIGRPLCSRPLDDPAPTPARLALWKQARLVFDYLDIDRDEPVASYKAALADIEAVEPTVTDSGQRFRLLGLRAQIEAGRGEPDRARTIVSYLRTLAPGGGEGVEDIGDGLRLVPESSTATRWLDHLERSLSAATARAPRAGPSADRSGRALLGIDPALRPPPPPAPPNERIDDIQVILPPRQPQARPAVPVVPPVRIRSHRWP